MTTKNRKLNSTELVMAEKGIARIEEDIIKLKGQIRFNELTIEFQHVQQTYQDNTRDYLRAKKDLEDGGVMKCMVEDLKMKETVLANLRNQIENGIDEGVITSLKGDDNVGE